MSFLPKLTEKPTGFSNKRFVAAFATFALAFGAAVVGGARCIAQSTPDNSANITTSGDCRGVTMEDRGDAVVISRTGEGFRRVEFRDAGSAILGRWGDGEVVTTDNGKKHPQVATINPEAGTSSTPCVVKVTR